jgi:cytochrome c-type biogenesis protein CcmH/NrfF
VNGWLLWGLVLPILLVVAGTVVILRRRNDRR